MFFVQLHYGSSKQWLVDRLARAFHKLSSIQMQGNKERRKETEINQLKFDLQKRGDSNLRRLVTTASVYGNRCHTMLRCQYKMFRRYFRQVDESTKWHCMARQLYRKPVIIIYSLYIIIRGQHNAAHCGTISPYTHKHTRVCV